MDFHLLRGTPSRAAKEEAKKSMIPTFFFASAFVFFAASLLHLASGHRPYGELRARGRKTKENPPCPSSRSAHLRMPSRRWPRHGARTFSPPRPGPAPATKAAVAAVTTLRCLLQSASPSSPVAGVS